MVLTKLLETTKKIIKRNTDDQETATTKIISPKIKTCTPSCKYFNPEGNSDPNKDICFFLSALREKFPKETDYRTLKEQGPSLIAPKNKPCIYELEQRETLQIAKLREIILLANRGK